MSHDDDAERVKRLWEIDRAEPLLQLPFLGLLAMHLELVVGDRPDVPTAGTDGRHVFGNPGFLSGITPQEGLFVLAHEVWHCAALHPLRRGDREARRWNHAADYETNAVLQESGLTVPQGALIDKRFQGMSAETIYERLPKQPKGRGAWADTHEVDGGISMPGGTSALENQWRVWPGRVRAALQQAGMRPGNMPGGVELLVDSVLTPRLDWREALRNFVVHRLSANRSLAPKFHSHELKKASFESLTI